MFERHTVFENLELAMKCDKRVWPTLTARLDSSASDRIWRSRCAGLEAGLGAPGTGRKTTPAGLARKVREVLGRPG